MFDKNFLTKAFTGVAVAAVLAGGLAGCAPEKTQEEKAVDALKKAGLITDKPKYPPATEEEYLAAVEKLTKAVELQKQNDELRREIFSQCNAVWQPYWGKNGVKIGDFGQACWDINHGPMTIYDSYKEDVSGLAPEEIGRKLAGVNEQLGHFEEANKKDEENIAAAREEIEAVSAGNLPAVAR